MARQRTARRSGEKPKNEPRGDSRSQSRQVREADAGIGEGPSYKAVLSVAFLVAVALAFVCLGILPGRLYVKASSFGSQTESAAFVACVYDGDVFELLTDADASNDPQARAAVSLAPGVDTQIEGLSRGTYTVVIVGPGGTFDPAAGVFVTELSGSDSHVGFLVGGPAVA